MNVALFYQFAFFPLSNNQFLCFPSKSEKKPIRQGVDVTKIRHKVTNKMSPYPIIRATKLVLFDKLEGVDDFLSTDFLRICKLTRLVVDSAAFTVILDFTDGITWERLKSRLPEDL